MIKQFSLQENEIISYFVVGLFEILKSMRPFAPLLILTIMFCLASLSAESPTHTLTFEEALQYTLAASPTLRSTFYEALARRGEALQASLFPNPELSLETENVGGSGAFKGYDAAETTCSIAQQIELGTKRKQRKEAASLNHCVALWEREVVTLETFAKLKKAFVTAFAAQEKVSLAHKQHSIANEVFRVVSAKVEAGKDSQITQNKAEIAATKAQLLEQKAQRFFEVAKKQLAAFWNCPNLPTDQLSYPFFEAFPTSDLETFNSQLCHNPLLGKWDAEVAMARRNLALEQANRIPDINVSAGVRNHHSSDDYAFVFEASLPFPIFDRNQGNIAKARSLLCLAKSQREEALLNLKTELAFAYEELTLAYTTAQTLKDKILKEAMEAFEYSKEGFQQGKYEYLDMLDAQRTYFEIQEEYIESLVNYHNKKADVEQMIGTPSFVQHCSCYNERS